MRQITQNSQMRGIALALIGAIVAATATMFVPAAIIENITGSTGLSEMVPATGAPLGDTARALIAFGTGAVVLAILAIFLSRPDAGSQPQSDDLVGAEDAVDARPTLIDRLPRFALPTFALPKMPWVRGEDDITDFSDLPKLRGNDVHPDAPPRRPLIATQDLPELDLATVGTAIPDWVDTPVAEVAVQHVMTPAEVAPTVEAAVEETAPVEEIAPVEATLPPEDTSVRTAVSHEPTLAEMVAQLEAAVAQRQQQLVALEVAANELAKPAVQPEPENIPEPIAEVAATETEILPPEPARFERPALEAVPASRATQDNMDAALTAALETLQRMNATAR